MTSDSPIKSPRRIAVLASVGRVSNEAWVNRAPVPRKSLPPPLTVNRKRPLERWPSETDVTSQTAV